MHFTFLPHPYFEDMESSEISRLLGTGRANLPPLVRKPVLLNELPPHVEAESLFERNQLQGTANLLNHTQYREQSVCISLLFQALEVSDHFPVEVDLKPSPKQPLHSEL